MIYLVFSVSGLAAVAEEVSVAFGCVVTAVAHSAVMTRLSCVSGHWHRSAFAGTVMATAYTSRRLLANAMLSIGFVLKSGTRLSRSKEAVSEQPRESDLYLFGFPLHMFVYKVVRTKHYHFVTLLSTGILNCVCTLKNCLCVPLLTRC